MDDGLWPYVFIGAIVLMFLAAWLLATYGDPP